jgi:glucosamine-6-phosphate deaminase
MGLQPQHYRTHQAMGEALADDIIALIDRKPNAVIGLATGETPKPVYEALVRKYREAKPPIDFSHVRFFSLDEYVGLGPEDNCSFHHYLWENLLGPIGATPELVRLPKGNAPDMQAECDVYENAIKDSGGVDLWIVGLGGNGHLAFNEPASSFPPKTHITGLTEETRRANAVAFKDKGRDVPPAAITVGIGTLQRYATRVALVVSGEKKGLILANALHGEIAPEVPASILQTMNGTCYFDHSVRQKMEALSTPSRTVPNSRGGP